MSKKIVAFRNKGVIDPKSITTFGVSSKEGEGAIGFFGTGLKYAISIILRQGGSITIYAGMDKMEFGTRQEKIRVDEFTFVTMNGQALGFTTEVGKTWETWQAFRELYCNTLDEQGDCFVTDEEPEPAEDETLIIVRGKDFYDSWVNRDAIILGSEPLHQMPGLDVHAGASEYVFYRGIRALKLSSPSIYTYNISSSMDLTEDRTIKHSFYADHYIRQGLSQLTDKYAISRVVVPADGVYERSIDFSSTTPSEEFATVVRVLAKSFTKGLNHSAVTACRGNLLDSLANVEHMPLTSVDQVRMDRAIAFCKGIGFSVDEYPIVVTEFLGEGVLGRAHNDHIFISKRTLMMGTKMLCGTLIEEFIHLRHKLRDETYEMQNFLFDALVSMGEQLTGEPL